MTSSSLLADPGASCGSDFDGSGMLREGASNAPISGVGDVFVMKMRFPTWATMKWTTTSWRTSWTDALPGIRRCATQQRERCFRRWRRTSLEWFEMDVRSSPEGPSVLVTRPTTVPVRPIRCVTPWTTETPIDAMTTTLRRLDGLCATGMAVKVPTTQLDARFSDPNAVATTWDETRRVLEEAELFWISSVEPMVDPTSRRSLPYGSTEPSISSLGLKSKRLLTFAPTRT